MLWLPQLAVEWQDLVLLPEQQETYFTYQRHFFFSQGSNPSCHRINMPSVLTLLSLLAAVLAAVILVGGQVFLCITPRSQLGASKGIGPWCCSPSYQLVPVVKKPVLLLIPLGRAPNLGTWLLC